MPDGRGCPVCGWDGEVAVTSDYEHEYYTHVITKDGEMFRGSTCSMRTRPQRKRLIDELGETLFGGLWRRR